MKTAAAIILSAAALIGAAFLLPPAGYFAERGRIAYKIYCHNWAFATKDMTNHFQIYGELDDGYSPRVMSMVYMEN